MFNTHWPRGLPGPRPLAIRLEEEIGHRPNSDALDPVPLSVSIQGGNNADPAQSHSANARSATTHRGSLMPNERLLRILSQINSGRDVGSAHRLCEVSAEAVGASGAGIMLVANDAHGGTVCSSNEVSSLIEELQFTLGEGPCIDAIHLTHPVLEPDLANPAERRWPAFAPPAVAAGARAIFGFPLQLGAICVGALNLYRDAPGQLSDDQHADAVVLASVAARSVLTMQADAGGDELAGPIEAGNQIRFVVHQATGMVAVQLGVDLGEALLRLRAHAFATNRLVTDVAKDVVARRIRFGNGQR